MLSTDRGAPVDVTQLVQCGDVLYAASPYGDVEQDAALLPISDATKQAARRYVGSVWLVSLCERGAPAVSVAVSSLASDVVVVHGHITENPTGNNFFTTGIPLAAGQLPAPAEQIVQEVANRTGRRVASVPELVRAPIPYAPQMARWRMRLDRKVGYAGRASHVSGSADEIYVGFGESWHERGLLAPHGSQAGPPVLAIPHRGSTATLRLTVKPGFVNAFELVEVQP
jgi:hypothetical protein